MTDNLVPIYIPNNIITELKFIYDPLFDNITIYGTIKNPIFILDDIKALFEIKNIDMTNFIENKDYISNTDIKKEGIVDTDILLTKLGLLKIIYTSNKQISIKFQIYVTCLLYMLAWG